MDRDDLAKLVNASGFLFQGAVEEYVRRTTSDHKWEVIAREYPWLSQKAGRGGFADFIAARSRLRCVFECKRTQGAAWVFLVAEDAAPTTQLRTFWTYLARDGARAWGWDDLDFHPATLKSEFCVVRGASDDDKPMLERIAGDLVRACESLGREEIEIKSWEQGSAGYLPVIVTNAQLYACRVDPLKVDLTKGTLPSSARFEEVGVVRFRKALTSDVAHEPTTYSSLEEGLQKKERSVFIVNVGHLSQWLASLRELPPAPLIMKRYPWSDLQY